ncbi:FliM/FliN family flagellar motor switch protein [Azospirillum sp. SYSU D00513]|uniref:FliM/FliN family flagellar motor switch protein n=1 Tax=Azospirillum sp. SYSU D00513 TaxID=2812561 RepID=UPI001A95EADE|nr:FliM/FliN family flagellar motor switch protein [Azospirillum sp. SYSU D00513]
MTDTSSENDGLPDTATAGGQVPAPKGDAADLFEGLTEADMAAWGLAPDGVPVAEAEEPLAADDDAADMSAAMPARQLSQADIDALLGGDSEVTDRRSAIERVIEYGALGSDSMPMLDVIADRLARMLSNSMRSLTSDAISVEEQPYDSMRFGEYVGGVVLPAIFATAQARFAMTEAKPSEWDSRILLCFDSSLVYSLIELLMGGSASPKIKPDGRPFTQFEMTLMENIMRTVLDDLSQALSGLCNAFFDIERPETNPRFAAIALDTDAVTRLRLRVSAEERGGFIDIVIPRTALDPMRAHLSQRFVNARKQDADWEQLFRGMISDTTVPVQAHLKAMPRSLSDVMKWKVGTEIPLGLTPETPVTLIYGGMEAWRGPMGRKSNNRAVKLADKIFSKR